MSTDRRTEILQAACRVIARDGAHGLRMADVAREAGVSNALVHYYVATRAELLGQAFDFANDRAEQQLQARLDPAASAEERLHAALAAEFDDEPVVRESWALWNELWSAATHDDALRPRVELAYRRWLDTIEALVGEAGGAADMAHSAERLAALVDGLGSKVLVGILAGERAGELLREAIRSELRTGVEEPEEGGPMTTSERHVRAADAAPAVQRYTLPASAYTDPEILRRERTEVFARAWTIVCHVSQVAEPGAFTTTVIAGEPVAVLRGADGVLRALSNVCRHRAMRILDGRGTCPKVLRCPYHGWTYRQDGQLAAVPEARGFADLDREAVRLPSFRVEAYGGLVWACLSDETEPLDEFLGELGPRLQSLGLDRLVPLDREYVSEYSHNWKVVADNYLEGYHVPVGHPGLLRLLDYKQYLPALARRGAWIAGPFRDKPSVDRIERLYQRLLRPMPGFPEELRRSWSYMHVWPAQMIDIYPDMIDTWRVEPIGLDVRRTRTTSIVLHHPDEGLRDRLVRALNWRINGKVMDEDVELCDGVQAGLEALTYRRGVLNANEGAVANFHDLLREAVPGIDEA